MAAMNMPRLLAGLLVAGAGLHGLWNGPTVAAQATPGPATCTLVPAAEVEPLAGKASVSERSACRYSWGEGTGRHTLDVSTSDPKQMFAGIAPDLIKQQLQASVAPETADAVIPDVGEAAVFKADSAAYVHATAYVKGRMLHVVLDGYDALTRKDQVIALLKSAASRL